MGALRYWLYAAVLVTAAFFLSRALWIPAKAEVAQWLLERAWNRAQAGEPHPRPWPWADTYPVAVLEIPRLGLEQLVLEGASGRNLAFGPTALTPVTARDVVLSGHRDTHFTAIGQLQPGDLLRLTRRGNVRSFRVAWLDIVDSRRRELVLEDRHDRLTLVTCYPLDAPTAGGPLRLVVTALATPADDTGGPPRATQSPDSARHRAALSSAIRFKGISPDSSGESSW